MTYTPHTSYALARLAGCSDPDRHDGIGFDTTPGKAMMPSHGAVFLRHVEDAVYDQSDDWTEDTAHEIADAAVPVYTHVLWTTFVDLAAYEVDVSDLAGDENDMTKRASLALYMIAERLAYELRYEIDED